MFEELVTTLQSMNNTMLIVLFACIGVAYFKFIRPEMQDARTLRTSQYLKIESMATKDEFTKVMEAMSGLVTISMQENLTIVRAADEKINRIVATVDRMQQELSKHTDDSLAEAEDRTIRVDEIVNNTSNIEALIEHLIVELAKSGHIADTNTDQLYELKNRVAATKMHTNHMMELFNQQLITARSRTSKLNRIVNTRS